MKAKGSQRPTGFTVDDIPNKPGWRLCRFYENVSEHSTESGADTWWEYDEYHLEIHGARSSIETDVKNNYAMYLAAAKATEAPTETEKLRADLDFVMVMEGLS